MSKTKEYYHEQINERARGMGTVWEPYMFKYVVQFAYMGVQHTLFADTYQNIEMLASDIFKEPVVITNQHDVWEFLLEDLSIPAVVIEVENPRYR
jgi:hypothetical protein